MSATNQTGLWDPREVPRNKTLVYQMGPLTLGFDNSDQELLLWSSRDGTETDVCHATIEDQVQHDGATIERFTLQSERPVIRLLPIMPDRSVVVRPENAISILPGQTGSFFVSLPVWVRIELAQPEPIALKEIPSEIRSNTWLGTTYSGELCYLEKSTARRTLMGRTKRDWRVTCPISIQNRHQAPLEITHICIQVRHLGVFQGQEHLWTHPVKIVHEDEPEHLEVTYGRSAPDHETIIKTLSEPRVPARKSLLEWGLSSLRRS